MLVKELKQELNKFSDETQIFVGVKDDMEENRISLADFSEIKVDAVYGFAILVATKTVTLASLFQLNK